MNTTTFLCATVFAVMVAVTGAAAAAGVDPAAPCFRWPAVDMDGDGVFDRIDNCVNTPAGCSVDAHGCHTDGDHDGVCDGFDRCPDTPPGTQVDASGCPGAARAARVPPPPPVRVPSAAEKQLLETGHIRLETVYFESKSARLLPESETALREAGEALERYPQLQIEVQGHTDTRSSASYNQKLSQMRAEEVRNFLLSHFQLRPESVIAKGYGESQPETKERNEEEFLRNRRVEVRVLNPEVLPRVKIENH